MRTGLFKGVAVGCAVIVPSACAVNALPTRATVTVELTAPAELALVVSTRFRTVENSLVFSNADTVDITADFSQVYALNEEARISATLTNLGDQPEIVRLLVTVDGRVQFDDSGTLAPGGELPFVYRFQVGVAGI